MKILAALGLMLTTSVLLAQETPAPAPASARARQGTLRSVIKVSGKFQPARPAEIKLDCERFRGAFELEMIAPHGSWVNKGDVIARIARKPYTEALEKATLAMERSLMESRHYADKVGMDAEKRLEGLRRTKRDAARAAKRLKGYRELEKGFNEESLRLSRQGREHRMDNQKDELTQLEKMYSEDELVDATEEIVLKRQRRSYARSLANHDLGERRRKYTKEWYEAEREENLVAAAELARTALKRALGSAEAATERAASDLAQRQRSLEKQQESLKELQADEEQLTVRAPYRGLLLHGSRGKYAELRKGGSLKNRVVFAELMKPGALEVSGTIKEADILRVKPGLACEVRPTAMKHRRLTGDLRYEYLPLAKGGFEATITLKEVPAGVRPGMTGAVQIVLTEERDAVIVPMSAVHGKFVTVIGANGKTEKRAVVTGTNNGRDIVIREGLKADEMVRLRSK